jgi:hypothetical protein
MGIFRCKTTKPAATIICGGGFDFYFSKIERVAADCWHIYAANIKVRSIFPERDLTGFYYRWLFSGCQGASIPGHQVFLFFKNNFSQSLVKSGILLNEYISRRKNENDQSATFGRRIFGTRANRFGDKA